MTKTALEQLKELEFQKNKILEEAKAEALHKIEELLEDLASLGLHYELVRTGGRSDKVSKATRQMKQCTICGFDTSPPHDGRKHRAQDKKKPFTASELDELGLHKI